MYGRRRRHSVFYAGCVCLLPKTSLQAKLFCSLNHTGVVFFPITLAQRALISMRCSPWSHCLHTEWTSAFISAALKCAYMHTAAPLCRHTLRTVHVYVYTHTRSDLQWWQISGGTKSSCLPDWPPLLSHVLAGLLERSHKCHITSSRGTTNRNINTGRMREKSFFRSLSLFSPSANRLVPNPPGIRGDKLSLIGYIGINKHMSVANGSTLQKAIFIESFRLMCSLEIVLCEIIEFCQWDSSTCFPMQFFGSGVFYNTSSD